MKKEIIAKVILHTTGNVHIMMSNYLSVYATLENVLELFVDGYSFISSGYEKFETSEKELRGISRSVDLFQGLTLAKVYDDGSIEIIFPMLMRNII